jgi:hypothetical protein
MRIAIIQSAYIPWKGFFDLIGRCDEYVIFDSAQFVKRHWHNRNKIKTVKGVEWLTIPVMSKGRYEQRIDEVEIEPAPPGKGWAEKHWRAIELAYSRAPHFASLAPQVQEWYKRAALERRLTDVNEIFIRGLSDMLGLTTRIVRDDAYPADGVKTERLLAICRAAGAGRYLTGPTARGYFDEDLFREAAIDAEWMSYEGYAPYPQPHGTFEHGVSVLDLLFSVGVGDARRLMRPVLDQA